ncbi:MAG: Tetratricopeptide repeat, partial [Chthonomonadales bacterium]|nr:Tetratricopeptide repeat [Chthonomonadales bacterium]
MSLGLSRFALVCVFVMQGLACLGALPAGAQSSAGDALFATNKFEAARSAYTSAVKASPKQASLRVGLIRDLIRLDAWADAISESKAAVTALPQSADMHGLLAITLLRGGQPEAAQKEADLALKLDTNSYWTMVAGGRLALWQNNREEAQSLLNHATQLHPDWPEAWLYLLEAYDARNAVEARKAVDAYRKLNPKGYPHEMALEGGGGQGTYAKSFEKDPPMQATGKLNDKVLQSADDGKGQVVSTTFPIERDEFNFILVPVKINGAHFKLLYDTGAGTSLSLGESKADHMGLPILGKAIAHGVNGKETAKLFKADTLEVGDLQLRSIPLEGSDNKVGPADGLFGGAIFRDFVVTVDFERNEMTLTRGKKAFAPPPPSGFRANTIPFRLQSGYIFVPTNIADRNTWCMLDTGASGVSLISLSLAKQIAAERGKATYEEGVMEGRFGVGVSNTKVKILVFGLSVPIGLMKDGR